MRYTHYHRTKIKNALFKKTIINLYKLYVLYNKDQIVIRPRQNGKHFIRDLQTRKAVKLPFTLSKQFGRDYVESQIGKLTFENVMKKGKEFYEQHQ